MKCFHYFKDKFRSKEQPSFKSSCSAASPHSISELEEAKALNLRVFSFSELRKATRNFNPELRIGEGGFGSVYKGKIKPANGKGEPLVVAIKKLNMDSFRGRTEWLAEIKFLGVVEHPNVIKLVGLCIVDGVKGLQRLLVYEFMHNKSLEDRLFNQAFPPLPWKTRLQIILGMAQALAYLHEGFKLQFPANDERFESIMDPRLGNQYSIGAAREIAKLANTCLSTCPKQRPKMSEVVERLEHIIHVSEEGNADAEASEIKEAPDTK
ncbi:hypothetical protein V6N12_022311 [Hibiscus sabdariffa]|uniref:Protein kinase domain-containing protein n=1 Tax=Hibiscus sabdariffa TaxID=183260 RepID=A0ABR2FUE8_9ROSI